THHAPRTTHRPTPNTQHPTLFILLHPRIFTLDEAERTLPLVKRIVVDLQNEYALWRVAVGEFELASAGSLADGPPAAEVAAAEQEVERLAVRVADLLDELEAIGCIMKGVEAGLVDFYALRDDRLVYLCWRLGESRITHWHDLDTGVDGRRPIDNLLSTGTA
ncbi:MAG TPA: DUF2203 domain-containing protein, partial [Gemmatimonadales bacterium]|nr:DUF2203 domain-containing protein [Gemmatimonadales bacterium]